MRGLGIRGQVALQLLAGGSNEIGDDLFLTEPALASQLALVSSDGYEVGTGLGRQHAEEAEGFETRFAAGTLASPTVASVCIVIISHTALL